MILYRINKKPLRELMASSMMSAAEVSRLAGIGQGHLLKLENGAPAKGETIRKIIGAFGLTAEDAWRRGLIERARGLG